MKNNKVSAIICILVLIPFVWGTWIPFFLHDDMKFMNPILSVYSSTIVFMFTITAIKDLSYWIENKDIKTKKKKKKS